MASKKNKKANDALNGVLNGAGGSGKKHSKKKKIIIASISVVLVSAIVVGSICIIRQRKSSGSEVTYREYKVQRGDITTGQTESSVLTLNKESITFPVDAEVLELYVKSGAEVKEGDALVKMDIDDINDAIEEYEKEIEAAESEVESAKLNRTTELEKARETKEQNILSGNQSDDKYSQDLKQAELDLSDAQEALDNAQDTYDDTYSKSLTFESDNNTLESYEAKMETAESTAEYWNNRQSSYNEVKSELNNVQSEIKQIADISNVNQISAYQTELEKTYTEACEKSGEDSLDALKAKENLNDFISSKAELTVLITKEERLEKEVSLYNADTISKMVTSSNENYEDAKEQYEDFKSDFTDKYGQITTSDEMDAALESASTALEKAKLNLKKQQTSYNTSLLQAQQTKSNSDLTADTADETYNLQKIQLDQKVNDAVDNYNTLTEELADIKESLGNDGIITAPCDGIVSSIDVEEGDTVSVSSSDDSMFGSSSAATLLTITSMTDAYVTISISEDEILDVSLDQDASVSLEAFPDETFDAIVNSITVEGATIGAATVTYDVTVYFTQEGYELYDGMSADVTLIDGQAKDVLYISKQAITTKDNVSYVNLKGADGNPVKTEVSTGFTDGQYTEIISGLNEGDTVLVESAIGNGATDGSNSSGMPDMGSFDTSDMSMPSGDFSMPSGGGSQ